MIMNLIKKHTLLLTLGAVLLCSFAAPYLITENPDSPLFRSGTLGLILLLAASFPAKHSLTNASLRTLLCGLGLGLLFAIALSLGAELSVYGGLIPGTSSFLRRLAVPFMAAPLFGLLFSYLMCITPRHASVNLPFWFFAAVIFFFWLPLLFTYFPAALNYDFPGQIGQYLDGRYSDSQPMLHTAFAAACFTLGETLFSSRTVGLLLTTLIQMPLFALALAYACTFAQRHGAPLWLLLVMTAYFALHPLFSVMSISTTKDTLFAAAILVLSLQTYEIIEEGSIFFKNPFRVFLYVITAACIALLRSNGLIALLLTLLSLLIVCRNLRKKVIILCSLCAFATVSASVAIDLIFVPESMSIHQSLSLPAQQLVRAYNLGSLTDETKEEIKSWYINEMGLTLHPYLADGAKGYLNDARLEEEMKNFISLWAHTFAKCPREYIEAFLMLNLGSWYPDDLTHSNIYRDASYVDKGYLQTIEYDMSEYGIHTRTFLPRIKAFYESICRANKYQDYPFLSHMMNTALPLWLLLFAAALLTARNNNHFLPSLLCSISLWGTYLFFGPCTLARYALPLFICWPPLLSAVFFSRRDNA